MAPFIMSFPLPRHVPSCGLSWTSDGNKMEERAERFVCPQSILARDFQRNKCFQGQIFKSPRRAEC